MRPLRACCICHVLKPIDAYHRTRKRGQPGFSYTCRSCHSAYKRGRKVRLEAARRGAAVATEKVCTKCDATKPINLFGRHAGNADGYNHVCRECASKASKRTTSAIRQYVIDLKSERPCHDCGRILPYWVMQFDHRDAATKEFQIGTAAGHSVRGKQRLLNEIAKCDLVCANCHAHRTYCRGKGMAHFVLEAID